MQTQTQERMRQWKRTTRALRKRRLRKQTHFSHPLAIRVARPRVGQTC